jgi:hypothetical protein
MYIHSQLEQNKLDTKQSSLHSWTEIQTTGDKQCSINAKNDVMEEEREKSVKKQKIGRINLKCFCTLRIDFITHFNSNSEGCYMCLGGCEVSKHHFEYKEEVLVKVAVLLESSHSFRLVAVSIQIFQRILKYLPWEQKCFIPEIQPVFVIAYKTSAIPVSKTTVI